MKITNAKVPSFISELKNNSCASCLVYGPNQGLASILCDQIIDTVIGINTTKITLEGSAVENDASQLYNELFNGGLFDDKKLIFIRQAGNKFTAIISAIFKNPSFEPANNFILVSADDLDSRSSLRMLYEKDSNAGSIGCYEDDKQSNALAIREFFTKHKLEPERNVVDMIADKFTGDRLMLINDLHRLSLYLGERKTVTAEDVNLVIDESKSLAIDQCVDYFAMNENAKSLNELNKILIEDVSLVVLVRYLVNHFSQLRRMIFNISKGSTAELELQKERIFFKRTGNFSRQLRLWTIAKIDTLLLKLVHFEIEIKRSSGSEEKSIALAQKLLLNH
jgi:DNA polymerase-3 subunit delta